MPGHELSGVVSELGYGTTGLTVGQRVFGLADWTRDGALAEYTAVEARNLAPLPADIDYAMAAAVPISGLTAWQGLFDHAGLKTGQTVLIHGAAGGVGSMAVQLAHELGSRVIGTGRAADREAALGLGADVFVDLQADRLEEVGEVDVVFDVIGGEVLERSAPLVRAGGTLVTIIGLPQVRPADGRAIFFVVEPDRLRLADLAERVRSGRLQPIIGAVRPLAEAPSAFTPDRRMPGKTIIRVTEGVPETEGSGGRRSRCRVLGRGHLGLRSSLTVENQSGDAAMVGELDGEGAGRAPPGFRWVPGRAGLGPAGPDPGISGRLLLACYLGYRVFWTPRSHAWAVRGMAATALAVACNVTQDLLLLKALSDGLRTGALLHSVEVLPFVKFTALLVAASAGIAAIIVTSGRLVPSNGTRTTWKNAETHCETKDRDCGITGGPLVIPRAATVGVRRRSAPPAAASLGKPGDLQPY